MNPAAADAEYVIVHCVAFVVIAMPAAIGVPSLYARGAGIFFGLDCMPFSEPKPFFR